LQNKRFAERSKKGCGQSLATNALKHLMDQLEERILQINQLKNTSKCLQHRVDQIILRC